VSNIWDRSATPAPSRSHCRSIRGSLHDFLALTISDHMIDQLDEHHTRIPVDLLKKSVMAKRHRIKNEGCYVSFTEAMKQENISDEVLGTSAMTPPEGTKTSCCQIFLLAYNVSALSMVYTLSLHEERDDTTELE